VIIKMAATAVMRLTPRLLKWIDIHRKVPEDAKWRVLEEACRKADLYDLWVEEKEEEGMRT